jgi:hypothetical protein
MSDDFHRRKYAACLSHFEKDRQFPVHWFLAHGFAGLEIWYDEKTVAGRTTSAISTRRPLRRAAPISSS